MTSPQASAPQPPADRAPSARPPRPHPRAEPGSERGHAPAPTADHAPTAEGDSAARVACGAEIRLHLVTGPGTEIPFPARLTYTQADPYAVRLQCRTGPAATVTWVLSRDTLRHGLDRPSGLGDVRIRPAPSSGPGAHGQESVLITLGSGRDAALLRGETAQLQRFLELSAAVVPPGTEHRHLDIDALISRLRSEP
ncbi:SsgA family sporulation/cell division regulator [Streptacidiphilus neutrinimicus]|uniref:SsgA family sporulation/cell division regulator n=1 Tax=Streptacidiphilus neutrinimicus TaxID=105420 RepID=UPI0006941AFB|nr:SsgA family sporulation/cell division regulator [Streptacidiphilus neutrinimicus]